MVPSLGRARAAVIGFRRGRTVVHREPSGKDRLIGQVVAAMATATWNNIVIASSDDTVVVEGNRYFPLEAVSAELLSSDTQTLCPWKGTASYYSVKVGDEVNPDAAWFYPAPKDAAAEIKDRVAFWHGIVVTA
jgi:uncharacterized protein (DUF427 family)